MAEAAGSFVLWAVQFVVPGIRGETVFVYGAWAALELARRVFGRRELHVFGVVAFVWRTHVRR